MSIPIPKPESGYLTIQEVAQRTRLGSSSISRLIHDGRLRARRIGRRWLIAAQDVERPLTGESL